MVSLVYILMALGFTLIFGIMRIVNFAHGELYMIGAYVVYVLVAFWGWSYYAAIVGGCVALGLFGALLERVLFRHVMAHELRGMILALAISISLQALAFILFGTDDLSVGRPITGVLSYGSIVISKDRVFVGAAAVAMLLSFYVFMRFTKAGLAMRAVAQDEEIATIYGIRPGLINPLAFGIGSMLAGFAGALMAPVYTITPYMGVEPMLKAFIVVILGGLGSIPGAVLGGLVLGILESLFATMINTTVAAMVSFGVVVIILIIKPNGLMGKRH